MECLFAVDKKRSLEIIQTIIDTPLINHADCFGDSDANTDKCSALSYYEDKFREEFDKEPTPAEFEEYLEERELSIIKTYRHKLSVVNLYVETPTDNIANHYQEIIRNSQIDTGPYSSVSVSDVIDRDKSFAIRDLGIVNDTIQMEAFTDLAECDWSYPTFTYDEYLRSWVIKEDFWSAPNGIGRDGAVCMLDFSNYKTQIS